MINKITICLSKLNAVTDFSMPQKRPFGFKLNRLQKALHVSNDIFCLDSKNGQPQGH